MPAVDTARVDHADARVAAELEGLAATAERLRSRNDLAPPGTTGAHRTVTLHLPGPSWASAGLVSLRIPPAGADQATPEHTVVSWRVEGGGRRTHTLDVPVVGPPGGLTLAGGGSRAVVAELTRADGRRVVCVRRRGFKSHAAASVGHEVAENGVRRQTDRRVRRVGVWL
jgi:hypothetical protein